MAKYVVLGLEGESGLYVVDIEGGTVSKAESSGDSSASRGGSGQTVRGVTVAVATDSREDAASGKLD